jgi:hypothetical protein
MRASASVEWTTELERLALHQLIDEYAELNHYLFGGKLTLPTLRLADGLSQLGLWEGEIRSISVSRTLVREHPWGRVTEVLKHEMAHQFVAEVLGVSEPTAHGPLFQRVCSERGIDGAASGLTTAPSTGEASVLHKIRQLLALAESSERHEAEAAAAAAQRLMLKHNLRTVGDSSAREYCFAHLGAPTGRVEESQRRLASILRDFFFVQVIWVGIYRAYEGKRGTVLEVMGTRENVELAEYVHSFLNHSAAALWRDHKRRIGTRSDRDRRAFVAGVMTGFYKKLKEQRKTTDEQGLVWQGDQELSAYYKRRFPRTTSIHYGSSAGRGAHAAGQAAGGQLVLHRGVSAGPSAGSRLLGR